MCITAATAALIAAGTTAAATIYSVDQSRKQGNQARDAQAKVDTMATQTANARLAQRRRALSANSLVTDQSAGMASGGRQTLGGG